MILSASPLFGLAAFETNPGGYTVNTCYECKTVSTIGISNYFHKKITIVANKLDCSTALTDAGFVDPPAIAYNSASKGPIKVVAGYSTIFNHA